MRKVLLLVLFLGFISLAASVDSEGTASEIGANADAMDYSDMGEGYYGCDKQCLEERFLFFDKECKEGNLSSCLHAAFTSRELDLEGTGEYFAKTCSKGFLLACAYIEEDENKIKDLCANDACNDFAINLLLPGEEWDYKTDPKKGSKIFEAACSKSSPKSCSLAARVHADRLNYLEGFSKDLTKAAPFAKMACDVKDAQGCAILAEYLLKNEDAFLEATRLFKKACEDEDAKACVYTGAILETAENEWELASQAYRKACNLYYSRGCSELARMYEQGREYNTARATYRMGCDRGDAYGCAAFGLLYERGLGDIKDDDRVGFKDLSRAKELYKHACSGQEPGMMGRASSYGCALLGDFARAGELARAGCLALEGEDCYVLGLFALMRENYEEAVQYRKMACSQGFAQACYPKAMDSFEDSAAYEKGLE